MKTGTCDFAEAALFKGVLDDFHVVITDQDFMKPLWLALEAGGAHGGCLGDNSFPVSLLAFRGNLRAMKMTAQDQIDL